MLQVLIFYNSFLMIEEATSSQCFLLFCLNYEVPHVTIKSENSFTKQNNIINLSVSTIANDLKYKT